MPKNLHKHFDVISFKSDSNMLHLGVSIYRYSRVRNTVRNNLMKLSSCLSSLFFGAN